MSSPTKKKPKTHARLGAASRACAPSQPPLLDAPSTRPIGARFLRAAQITALAPGFDGAKLRRLADPNLAASLNPLTKTPWLPKPVASNWPHDPTLAGIIAYLEHQALRRDGLPETYASKKDFCAATKFPEAMLDHATARGCRCKDDHGRISLTPFLDFWAKYLPMVTPLLVKLLNGETIAGLDLENLVLTDEQAKLTRVRKNSEEVDYQLKVGRVHDLAAVERKVFLEIVVPWREFIVRAAKKVQRLAATQPTIGNHVVLVEMLHFMTRFAQGQPALGLWEPEGGSATGDYEI